MLHLRVVVSMEVLGTSDLVSFHLYIMFLFFMHELSI